MIPSGADLYLKSARSGLFEANEIYGKISGGKSYDRFAIFKATKAQIQRGIVFANRSSSTYYSLIGNSCTTLVSHTMGAIYRTYRPLLEGPVPRINFETRKVTYNMYFSGTIKLNSPLFIQTLKYLD